MNSYAEIKANAQLAIEWATAREDGKPFLVEVQDPIGSWSNVMDPPCFSITNFIYRRKPEAKLMPLDHTNVTAGSAIRYRHDTRPLTMLIICVYSDGVRFHDGWSKEPLTRTWIELMQYDINRNDGNGWVPCSKLAEDK